MRIQTELQLVLVSHSIPYEKLDALTEELTAKYGTNIDCSKLHGHYVITFKNRLIPIIDITEITHALVQEYSGRSVYLRTSLHFISEREVQEMEARSVFRVISNKKVEVVKDRTRRCNTSQNTVIVGTYINQKDSAGNISYKTLVLTYRRNYQTGKIQTAYDVYDHSDPVIGFYKSPIKKKISGKNASIMTGKLIDAIKSNVEYLNEKYKSLPLPLISDNDTTFFKMDISKYAFSNTGDLT